MVRLRIVEILEEQEKSKYWLWKRLDGMSYQNFNAIVTNKTTKEGAISCFKLPHTRRWLFPAQAINQYILSCGNYTPGAN